MKFTKLKGKENFMDYENFLNLVKMRRSIRNFKPDPIPDDYIEKIIEAARWAPSGANSQPWEFIIIKDKSLKDKIVDILLEHAEYSRKVELTREESLRFPSTINPPKEPGFKNAPVFIVVCGDPRTKEAYPLLTMITRGDSHFVSGLASAFLYMALAATALGLGAQWISATGSPYVKCILKQLLRIPEKIEIYDMMALGFPAYKPGEKFLREISEMVHYERYDSKKFRDDNEIRDFIIRLRKGR